MKKPLFFLAVICILTMTSCKNESSGYIGRSDIRIDNGIMTPETLLSLGRLSDPQLSPDGKRILYGVSYISVAENRSCRNLFLCDVDGGNAVQLTRYAKSVTNARWSRDGKSIRFIQDGQIWEAPVSGNKLGKKVRLSNVATGVSEFKVSADESVLIYVSSIKNKAVVQPVDTDPTLDKARAYATEDLMYRHWDHWVTETPRTYVAALNGSEITLDNSFDILGSDPYELPTEPFGGIEQLDINPQGRYVAYSCRKKTGKDYVFSTDTEIYIYDITTGCETVIPMGGGYDTDPVWSPDGSRIAWISMARDGYEADQQRLMVADVTLSEAGEGQSFGLKVGGVRELAASLDRDAAGIFWTPDGNGIVFNALTDGVQALYSVNAEGEPVVKRLTKEEWWFDFSSPFAYVREGDGFKLLTSYSCMNFPVELVSVSVDAGGNASFSPVTNENGHIIGQLDEIGQESVLVETVDHQQMQCWVLYPPHFDETKVYPAIEIVLGGPQSTNSQDWSYRWCYRLMAQQGYIVILPNRRGTTAFGQAWKEEISGDYCGLNMQDYLCAGRWLKSKPYVGKLACVGASYGGYSAYMLEGIHGDLYDCFISHAGIFDEAALYYTTEEMWFADWDNGGLGRGYLSGSPWSNCPESVRHYANSPLTKVQQWHTPILCIHGMNDFRIPYTQGMAAFNCAQMMGVPSKLLIFPEENHWILQPQNSLFWYREVFDWLGRWCK